MENSNIFQKGQLGMNIYNKATLTVILIITIIISFVFYYFTSDEKVDKDKLYENKIANHKSQELKIMVLHPIMQLLQK